MWSRFRLFIHLAKTGPSAGHPKFFQWSRKIISIRTMLAIKQLR
jgi:hypothetical protein